MPANFDFFAPEFQENVHRHFARMRDECLLGHEGEQFRCFAEKIGERRLAVAAAAAEELPWDTLTALITAELGWWKLTDVEIMAFMSSSFIAGSQTTMHSIGNMIYWLLQNSGWMKKVRWNPELMVNAVGESLRYDASVNGLFRK